ncbi:IS3 family transposase [Chloroflexota bacterium]
MSQGTRVKGRTITGGLSPPAPAISRCGLSGVPPGCLRCQCFSGAPWVPLCTTAGTRSVFRRDIFHYIEVLRNRKRLHSSLGYVSPAQYEQSLKMCAN